MKIFLQPQTLQQHQVLPPATLIAIWYVINRVDKLSLLVKAWGVQVLQSWWA